MLRTGIFYIRIPIIFEMDRFCYITFLQNAVISRRDTINAVSRSKSKGNEAAIRELELQINALSEEIRIVMHDDDSGNYLSRFKRFMSGIVQSAIVPTL